MLEKDIKAAVISELIKQRHICDDALIANEFTLMSMSRRIDLAIMANDFIGIEIKSEVDNLNRLSAQTDIYLRLFDQVIVLVARKHLLRAEALLPKTVSIWSVNQDKSIFIHRKASRNFSPKSCDLAKLLTVSELRTMLGRKISNGLDRKKLLALAAQLEPREIRENVRVAFNKRFSITTATFIDSISKKGELQHSDLYTLSRFIGKRRRSDTIRQEREKFWKDWVTKSEAFLQGV